MYNTNDEIKTKGCTLSLTSDIKEFFLFLFNAELKKRQQFFIFTQFHHGIIMRSILYYNSIFLQMYFF